MKIAKPNHFTLMSPFFDGAVFRLHGNYIEWSNDGFIDPAAAMMTCQYSFIKRFA
jgi:hypothetical protein